MSPALHLAGDPAADRLLADNPFALLVGMLLDQQIPMEVAFIGPQKLAERLGAVDPRQIAAMDVEEFVAVCTTPTGGAPVPKSMGQRVHALAAAVVDDYGGEAARIWSEGSPDGREVLKRLKALPGFGDQKARIFLALLGKQLGLDASGWREAAGDYGRDGVALSIADVVDPDSLAAVRAHKREQKAARRQAEG